MLEHARAKLTVHADNSVLSYEAELLSSAEQLKVLANRKCWMLFQELAKRESYASDLAKKFNLTEQEVHYYLKKLRNAGLIELAKTEEKQGGIAKYFRAKQKCYALLPSINILKRATVASGSNRKLPELYQQFFEPFIVNGMLNAKLVVGAPDAHGTFKARARDAHIAAELACFLGSLCDSFSYPLVYLDTMLKHLSEENSNLIVIGGPITNRIALELNEYLPIKFERKNGFWSIKSELSSREYVEDFAGIIEKVQHPFFEDKYILYIAGRRNAGTRAAIMALIHETASIANGNKFDKSIAAHVVEGLDLDSDGFLDHVEILE